MRNKTLTLAMLAIATGPALAADVDTSEWTCSSCPFQDEYEGEASLGAGWISDDSAKFGEWNGLDEKGAHALADMQGSSRSAEGNYWRYAGSDLGLDSREASLALGRAGLGEIRLDYDGVAHRRFDTTQSPFDRNGRGRLVLPAGWVSSGGTAGLAALPATLDPARMGSERRGFGAALEARLGGRFDVSLDWRREEQLGTGMGYAKLLTVATALPMPVEASTDTLEFSSSWRGKRGFLRLSYLLSTYDNDITAVTFDNPFTPLAPDTSLGRISTAPDNSAWQVAIDGSLRLPWQGVLSFRLTDGSMEQDDAFLPISTSAVLGATPLARPRLDGQVDTSHHRVGLSLQPTDWLRGRGSYRFDRRDDNSPDLSVQYVIGDSATGGLATSRRYSYERTRFEASGEADVFDWLQVGAGADQDELERTGQAVDRSRETRTFGRIRFRPHSTVELNATGGDSYREASLYRVPTLLPAENPLLRKFNQANRNRDFAQGMLSWSPLPALSFAAEALYASDDYERSPLGLQGSDDRRFAGMGSWAINERLTVYVSSGLQRIDTRQTGQEGVPGATVAWSADHEDRFRTWGGGLQWRPEDERWRVSVDYSQADAKGRIVVTSASPLAADGPLPLLESELKSARMTLGYRVNERLQLRLAYAFEEYDSSDWALASVGPATLPNVLGFGAIPHRYSVHAVGLSFTFRFGGLGPRASNADEDE